MQYGREQRATGSREDIEWRAARALSAIRHELSELDAWFETSPPGVLFHNTPKGVLETLDRIEREIGGAS